MTEAQGSIRVLGSLRTEDGRGVVRMEDRFHTDPEDLWSALTDPARLARWYGEVDGELRTGGELRVRVFASGWEGMSRIEMCEPPRRFVVVGKDADEADGSEIDVTLTPDGEHTVLVVEQRGVPVEHLAAYGAGVQIHVEDLAHHVAGLESDAASRSRAETDARWNQLEVVYREGGVGAST